MRENKFDILIEINERKSINIIIEKMQEIENETNKRKSMFGFKIDAVIKNSRQLYAELLRIIRR